MTDSHWGGSPSRKSVSLENITVISGFFGYYEHFISLIRFGHKIKNCLECDILTIVSLENITVISIFLLVQNFYIVDYILT